MTEILFFSGAVLLSSFVSGMTGLGGGVILLSFMTPVFPPNVLIPLHGIIQLFSNASRVCLTVKKVDLRIFLVFSLGAAIGSLASLPLNLSLNPVASTVILSAAILFFTWVPGIRKGLDFPGKFLAVGAAASFLSVFVGATGPLTAPFFLNSRLNRESFVPTRAACQVPVHLFKVAVYIFSGFLLSRWYLYILLSVPLVIAGNFAGKAATGKFEEGRYRLIIRIVITALVARSLYMIFR